MFKVGLKNFNAGGASVGINLAKRCFILFFNTVMIFSKIEEDCCQVLVDIFNADTDFVSLICRSDLLLRLLQI